MSETAPLADISDRPTIEAAGVEGEASIVLRDVTMSYVIDSIFRPHSLKDSTPSGLSPASHVETKIRSTLVDAGLELEGYSDVTVDCPDETSSFATVEIDVRVSVLDEDRDDQDADQGDGD